MQTSCKREHGSRKTVRGTTGRCTPMKFNLLAMMHVFQRFAAENGLSVEDTRQSLLRTAAAMVDRGWNSVLTEDDGNTLQAASFLRTELTKANNDHLFQVSLADYNNERKGFVAAFKDRDSLDKVLKNVALVDPLDYRTDAKYMQEVLNAKGKGSQEGFGIALEGAASGASKTALWAMGAVNCPSCAAEDIQNAWNSVLSIPEELRLKGYLDNLHIMQGSGADVIRGNESASTAAGVGLGLVIGGGLAGARLPEGSGAKSVPSIAESGASRAANAARLKMQMVAEQAAGARAPTQITSYSNHALEQFAGRDGGIVVSQSALSGAWSSPLKIEYVPSKYGPTFRYTGTDAVIVVNVEGKVVTGWGKSASGTGK